jgi:hypothetical protein
VSRTLRLSTPPVTALGADGGSKHFIIALHSSTHRCAAHQTSAANGALAISGGQRAEQAGRRCQHQHQHQPGHLTCPCLAWKENAEAARALPAYSPECLTDPWSAATALHGACPRVYRSQAQQPVENRFRWWLSRYPGDHGSNKTLQPFARSQDVRIPCRASAVEPHRSAASRLVP